MKERQIDAYQEYINTLPPIASYFDYNKANEEIKQQQGEPAQPLYQAPVNSGFDYGKANAEIEQQKTQAPPPADPKQVVEDIYTRPAPKYDQARQDRLKRLAKVNALGEGLKAVGDIFSLSQGAIVNRRQPDGKNDRLMEMFQGYEDDYSRRLDQHNRDEFNLKLQQLREKKQDDWRRADLDWRKSEAGRSQYNTDRQFGARELDREERRKDREQGRELQEKNMERMQKQFDMSHNLSERKFALDVLQEQNKLENTTTGAGDYKPFDLFTGEGKKVQIDGKNERDHIVQLILEDKSIGITQNDIDLIKPRMGQPVSDNALNLIIHKYWEKSPAAYQYISGKYQGGTTPKQTGNAWLDGLGVNTGTSQAAQPQMQKSTQQQSAPTSIANKNVGNPAGAY